MEEFIKSIFARARKLKGEKTTLPTPPEEIRANFDLELSEESLDPEAALPSLLEGIFKYSVNTQSPRFLNQLYGGTSEITWVGDLLTSILNTSMATYEIAPLATLMEKELIRAINQEIGFQQIDGLMVPGGSNANMMALHCARYARNNSIKEDGLFGRRKLHVYYSGDAHYSTLKAMSQLGMGTGQLIKVAVDKNHRMSVEGLERAIEQSVSDNAVPLCVVSTAGTTVWGSFDPIDEIQNVCEEHSLWHHVDAAWGGLALWSDHKDTLFRGVERVDSITMDFHKLMGSSLTKAFFLTKHPEVMYGANSGGGETYIFHPTDCDKMLDTGKYALQCGRKVDSLSLWLQWKLQGTARYRKKVAELCGLKQWCVEFLEKNAVKFRLIHRPEFMNICFQIIPDHPDEDFGKHNRAIRENLMANGDIMVNFSSSPEHGEFIRLVLTQWELDRQILAEIFEELERLSCDLSGQ